MNEFFDITRYSLTHIELELAPVDLAFLLAQVADEFYPALGAHGNVARVTGAGGERTAELCERVQRDVVEQNPDYVVLQVGINDVWCRFSRGEEVTPDTFRANYTYLVDTIMATGARLFLIQPYALKMGDKQRFRPFLARFNEIIRTIAAERRIPLIPTDEIFMGVTQDIDPAQFSTDGVHPTHRGCRYIADLLIKELKKWLN